MPWLLMPLWKQITHSLRRMPTWIARYIPRNLNNVADLLSHIRPRQLRVFHDRMPNYIRHVYLMQQPFWMDV